jgi:hypothetical protein
MASSNHAADWYEALVLAGKKDVVLPDERPLARNFYGWGKAAYEHMGFIYAQGAVPAGAGPLRKLQVVQLRIGHPIDLATEDFAGKPGLLKRSLGAYVSPRDLAQLVCQSIETASIDDAYGIPFQIFYGISNNTRAYWSIANARQVIGYAPEDDSELKYAALVREVLGDAAGRLQV